jgi:hypothetical protein
MYRPLSYRCQHILQHMWLSMCRLHLPLNLRNYTADSCRPCACLWLCRRLQREVDLLQRKIAAVRRQAASGQPGGAAAAGEDVLSAAAAAGDVWGGDDSGAGGRGRGRGTKTAIERDKALARLGLHVAEEFPRDVLVDIVQVCVSTNTKMLEGLMESGCCKPDRYHLSWLQPAAACVAVGTGYRLQLRPSIAFLSNPCETTLVHGILHPLSACRCSCCC